MTSIEKERQERYQKLASHFESTTSYPTSLLIYQCSKIIFEEDFHNPQKRLSKAWEAMLSSLPSRVLQSIIKEINACFVNCSNEEKEEGLKSLWGLFVGSKTAARHGFEADLCTKLNEMYEEEKDHVSASRNLILEIQSNLILNGLIADPVGSNEEEEGLNRIIGILSACISPNNLASIVEWQVRNGATTFQDAIDTEFPEDSPMKRYVLQIVSPPPVEPTPDDDVPAVAAIPEEEEADPRQVISELFPDLGLGYIETALACYNDDLDKTIDVLFQSTESEDILHPRLRFLDKNLPSLSSPEKKLQPDEEFLQKQKQIWKEEEQQAEQDLYLLTKAIQYDNMYEDDYDDQYDGIGEDGGACGVPVIDNGLVDYDAIKIYNKTVRDMESEDAFWEQNRNLNREKNPSLVNDADAPPTSDAVAASDDAKKPPIQKQHPKRHPRQKQRQPTDKDKKSTNKKGGPSEHPQPSTAPDTKKKPFYPKKKKNYNRFRNRE